MEIELGDEEQATTEEPGVFAMDFKVALRRQVRPRPTLSTPLRPRAAAALDAVTEHDSYSHELAPIPCTVVDIRIRNSSTETSRSFIYADDPTRQLIFLPSSHGGTGWGRIGLVLCIYGWVKEAPV
jgi:hypothetical protein